MVVLLTWIGVGLWGAYLGTQVAIAAILWKGVES